MATSGPPAVLPARLTLPASKPVTGSLNVTVNRTGDEPVGLAWVAARSIVTFGAAPSNRTVWSVLADRVSGLPAASNPDPAGTDATTVPSPVIPVTVTV